MFARKISLFLAVALVAAGGALPARATDNDGLLLIRGDHTASVDVVLTHPTSEPLTRRGFLFSDFVTHGSYAAYVLRPLDTNGPRARGALLAQWAFGKHPQGFQNLSDDRPLAAGWYRLSLVTDGPTSFAVTLPGYGETIRATPSQPFRASADYRELGAGVDLPATDVRQPFTRRPDGFAIIGVYVHSSLPIGEHWPRICVTAPSAPCDADSFDWGPVAWGPDTNDLTAGGWVQLLWILDAKTGGRFGNVDSYWHITGMDVADRRSLFLLTTDLP